MTAVVVIACMALMACLALAFVLVDLVGRWTR